LKTSLNAGASCLVADYCGGASCVFNEAELFHPLRERFLPIDA